MLKAKDFRKRAWDHLGGKWLGNIWGTFAIIALIYLAISAAGGVLSMALIGFALLIIVSGPLELGFAIVSLNVVRGHGIKVENIFDGFKNMASAIILWLINNIFIFLWTLLLIIPGIVKSYSYSMSFYILRDNPEMSQDEARRTSMAMMSGNKWRLFCLDFSFIGWAILCGLTFGILSVWIIPYHQTARAEFYQSLVDAMPQAAEPASATETPATDNTTETTATETPSEEPPAEPFEDMKG